MFFKKKKAYCVEWSYENDSPYRYSTFIKAKDIYDAAKLFTIQEGYYPRYVHRITGLDGEEWINPQ